MADLDEKYSAQVIKLTGADASGIETNYLAVDSIGRVSAICYPCEPVTFSISAATIPTANNKSMVGILNQSSSIVKVHSIRIINNQVSAVTGQAIDFRLKRISGLTSGTTVNINKHDESDTVTNVTVVTNGSVSGESAQDMMRRVWSSDEWGPGTTDVESMDHMIQQSFDIWNVKPNTKPIYLRQGQGLTLKCVSNTTAGNFDIEALFTYE